jgi:glutathione synthase/RimK-type ligase-like ATP-grasp enzyme
MHPDARIPPAHAMSVAILTDMVADENGLRLRHKSDAVLATAMQEEMPGVRLLLCDWRTLSVNDGTPGSVLALTPGSSTPIRVRLDKGIRLAHVLRIGYGATRASTLREKWSLFFQRLHLLRAAHIPVVNGYDALYAGHEKTYLRVLGDAGVPIVPSEFWSTETSLAALREARDGAWIVKPANGECGHMVALLDSISETDWESFRDHAGLAVLQPFMTRIAEGEVSLIYCLRVLVQSVLKRPRPGGILSNGEHVGATWTSHTASDAEAEVARAAIEAFPGSLDLCRVDLVQGAAGPHVIEIEAVDPGFLGMSRSRLARVLSELYRFRLHFPA